jgi:hypothetical protein
MNKIKTFLAFLAASLTLQAADAPIYTEQSITLIATADGNPPPTYEWFKNGAKVSEGDRIIISAAKMTDAGTYKVKATNPLGFANSNDYILEVLESSIPVFATQPQSQTVAKFSSATLNSAANGVPTPTYQWYKNNDPINGATQSTFPIASVNEDTVGTYKVTAVNFRGTATSNSATIAFTIASAPVFAQQPQNQNVNLGSPIILTSTADGNPTYQWYKNTAIGSSMAGVAIAGATKAEYVIEAAKEIDAGSYYVVASNSAGSTTSNTATVTINIIAPTIIAQPFDQSIKLGDPVVFTVSANGTALKYQWRKNGTNIAGATNATYSILATTKLDSASYDVIVSNTVGTITSNKAVLNVLYAPVFIQQPAPLVSVSPSSTLRLVTSVDGQPTPFMQWQKDGNLIAAEGSTLTINNVQPSDAGTYSLLATNSLGATKSTDSKVVVGSAPVFTKKLSDITARKFSTVTFSVTVEGATPLTYQWRKSNRIISGANTATLTLRSVNNPDSATYSVTVSNSFGSVVSSAALRVTN